MSNTGCDVLFLFSFNYCFLPSLPHLLLLVSHGLALALAGSRVLLRALAAYGQAFTMAQTAVTAQIHQALDINRNITAQFAFNKVVFVNYFTDFGNIFVRQFMNAAFTSKRPLLHR